MTSEEGGGGMGSRYPLAPTPLKSLYLIYTLSFQTRFHLKNETLSIKSLKTAGVGTKQDQGNSLRKLVSSPA